MYDVDFQELVFLLSQLSDGGFLHADELEQLLLLFFEGCGLFGWGNHLHMGVCYLFVLGD